MRPLGWIALFTVLLALVVVAAIFRGKQEVVAAKSKQPEPVVKDKRGYYVPPKDPGARADEKALERAVTDARLKSTFLNFRTAVATGNQQLQKSLRSALAKDRASAIKLAESHVESAKTPNDRDIAIKTLEALSQ